MVAVTLNSCFSVLRASQWQVLKLICSRVPMCSFIQKHDSKPVRGTRKLDPNTAVVYRFLRTLEKLVVPGRSLLCCLLGGSTASWGAASEYPDFKIALSNWHKMQGTATEAGCPQPFECCFLSPLCALNGCRLYEKDECHKVKEPED